MNVIDRLAHATKDDEVEITPKMIEAGEWAMVSHDPDHFFRHEIVESIYLAMIGAKNKGERD